LTTIHHHGSYTDDASCAISDEDCNTEITVRVSQVNEYRTEQRN
jgi:hypothetical protein